MDDDELELHYTHMFDEEELQVEISVEKLLREFVQPGSKDQEISEEEEEDDGPQKEEEEGDADDEEDDCGETVYFSDHHSSSSATMII